MTEEERDKMMRSNWVMQMAALGYGPDGMALPKEDVTPAGRAGQCPAPTDEAFGRWISVKDRLPERNGIYLAYDGEYIGTVEYEKCRPDSEWTDDYEGYLDLIVTHWMPLPEPPKEVTPDE